MLAQEFVNRYRKTKRLVSLEEQAEEGVQFSAAPSSEPAARWIAAWGQRWMKLWACSAAKTGWFWHRITLMTAR